MKILEIIKKIFGDDYKEWLDQLLHFLWTFIALAPVVYNPVWYMGALSGFLLCAPREFYEQWHGWPIGIGKIRDVCFFILGGIIITLIL